MTDMETAMIRTLAAIDDALGMPQDGCNNPAATLEAIALLHSVVRDDAAEIKRVEQQRDDLLVALNQMLFDFGLFDTNEDRLAEFRRLRRQAREFVAAMVPNAQYTPAKVC